MLRRMSEFIDPETGQARWPDASNPSTIAASFVSADHIQLIWLSVAPRFFLWAFDDDIEDYMSVELTDEQLEQVEDPFWIHTVWINEIVNDIIQNPVLTPQRFTLWANECVFGTWPPQHRAWLRRQGEHYIKRRLNTLLHALRCSIPVARIDFVY